MYRSVVRTDWCPIKVATILRSRPRSTATVPKRCRNPYKDGILGDAAPLAESAQLLGRRIPRPRIPLDSLEDVTILTVTFRDRPEQPDDPLDHHDDPGASVLWDVLCSFKMARS